MLRGNGKYTKMDTRIRGNDRWGGNDRWAENDKVQRVWQLNLQLPPQLLASHIP
jgi:hypothetical protein